MNNNSSFSKQDNVLAQSLDISLDIYQIPISNQVTKEDKSKNQPPAPIDPKSNEPGQNDSLSNIMNNKDKVSCPCCNNEKSKVLSQNPIFVEKREGSDPVFLDENEVQPLDEPVDESSPAQNIEKNEDIVSSQILELIKQDSFDPGNFSI